MLIKDLYANREIFITGGTGFLGKSLIEKILRDCPKVKVLYILLRGKKNLSAEKRLEELKGNAVFDRIRQECPEALNKLHAISGDSMELGLGINSQDLELIKNVSIIFHMAACVRFDDALRNSILLNSRGTYELLKIAETLKNLVCFLHCSTAYCNALNDVIEEKVYKMPVDWLKTIKIAETFDEETLNVLCLKYTGFYPNTYTFTKNLSEQIIQEYSTKIPITIFRPSVVINSFTEPEPGWVDNLNGVGGVLLTFAVGITPVHYCREDLLVNFVPVDYVSRLTLTAAYKKGLETLNKNSKEKQYSLEVINCAGSHDRTPVEGQICLHYEAVESNPMENCIWSFDLPWMVSYPQFLLYMYFLNLPISIILDCVLRLLGREPLLLKLQRRIMYYTEITKGYSSNIYEIHDDNMYNLQNYVPAIESNDFGVKPHTAVEYGDFMKTFVMGMKQYVFNQPAQASAAARKRAQIFRILNRTIKILILSCIVLYLRSLLP